MSCFCSNNLSFHPTPSWDGTVFVAVLCMVSDMFFIDVAMVVFAGGCAVAGPPWTDISLFVLDPKENFSVSQGTEVGNPEEDDGRKESSH